ncbi:sensor histidine kinase [Aquabacterium sp. OR-4]|uniref:sensor histidine kinase n=1 Tax=Aquabacterium sp. OR-4 TaxID=2978127 RepID=UPI0028C993C5|nr:ATP-binding protein [Aquabacterium sp. OR-4]MDT7836707.1 ATP-binding protein [Aquabacterium sp. OR-4]
MSPPSGRDDRPGGVPLPPSSRSTDPPPWPAQGMATDPGARAAPRMAGDPPTESPADSAWTEATADAPRRAPQRPVDVARRLLLVGLLGVVLLALWLRWAAAEPHLPARWRVPSSGPGLELVASSDPVLGAHRGQRLLALRDAAGQRLPAQPEWLARSPRWIVDDQARVDLMAAQAHLATAQAMPRVTLVFATAAGGEAEVSVPTRPRGLWGLGLASGALAVLALQLYLVTAAVLVWRPGPPALLYAAMALPQCLNLLLIGTELLPGLGMSQALASVDLRLRLLADAVTSAALVHLLLVHPQPLPRWRWLAWPAWTVALGLAVMAPLLPLPGLWWWTSGLGLGCGLLGLALLRWTQRHARHAMASTLLWLTLAGTGTLALLLLAIGVAGGSARAPADVAVIGPVVWMVFFAALLMLAPFLSRSQQVLRMFALLAGIASTVASLNLLFAALFPFGHLAALLLALLVGLGLYHLARHWIVRQLTGSVTVSAERMFDSLYRAARELEQSPRQASEQLGKLLREFFDPLQVTHTPRTLSRVRLAGDGSTLGVPVPDLGDDAPPAATRGALVLRHAQRGRRLFTDEDRQLTERVIEQLRRAVAYDRAVEHGRTEERTRIAQDLHDDIGARLLTLMYKAPDPEIEEYIRHTLQDLKTLTRGLAASNHRLSHAAAEWKSDITQRLSATGCDLHWSFSTERDLTLNVVQWSALTRVMRELVNNIISHAQATQVEITVHVDRGRFTLTMLDDGIGRAPALWAHGLGLGGVRKRVKQLGGQVQWLEQAGRGIRCEVQVPLRVSPDAGQA